MAPSNHDAQQITLGVVAILVAVVSLTAMDVFFVALIDKGYPVFMLQGIRNWVCVALMAAILISREGFSPKQLTRSAGLLIARGVVIYASAIMFFLSLKELDLGSATTLLFFYPVIATVLAAVFLAERIGIWRGVAVVIGFAGVVVALRPGSNFFQPAMLLPLAASLCFAVCQIAVRWVPNDISSLHVTFVTFLTTAVVGTPFLIGTWQAVLSTLDWVWILAASALVIIGAQAMTIAFRVAPVALIGSLDYSGILFAVLFGYLFFGDVPGMNIWLAMPLIAGAGVVIAVRESLVSKAQRARARTVTNANGKGV